MHILIQAYLCRVSMWATKAIMIYGRVVPEPPPLLPPAVAEDGRKLLERSSNPLCEGSRHSHSLLLIREAEADGRQMSFALFKDSTMEHAGQTVLRRGRQNGRQKNRQQDISSGNVANDSQKRKLIVCCCKFPCHLWGVAKK